MVLKYSGIYQYLPRLNVYGLFFPHWVAVYQAVVKHCLYFDDSITIVKLLLIMC